MGMFFLPHGQLPLLGFTNLYYSTKLKLPCQV